MARIVSTSGQAVTQIHEPWRIARSPPGACRTPEQAAQLRDWVAARVPGTTAAALIEAGLPHENLNDYDVWWRAEIEATGPQILCFEGLATLAEVWLDHQSILTSQSMFLTHEVEIATHGRHALWIVFRALNPLLDQKKLPRARWRPRMIPKQGLRGVRTTLMGQMPGWTPPVDSVGPWRPIVLLSPPPFEIRRLDLKSGYENGRGWLSASLEVATDTPPVLVCDGRRLALKQAAGGSYGGQMTLAGVKPWWPHTHGDQPLYQVFLELGETKIDLGHTGFRQITVDRGPDGQGFGLVVNGVPIFCRGACWTSAEVVGLSGGRETYKPLLKLAQSGGMNMLRMSGTGVYEGAAFYDLCDELGILVWQDFMFANFDYPIADQGFAVQVAEEVAQFLSARQLSPCLAVLCGGSEVHQQGAMLGVRPEALASPLFDEILPAAAQAWRPDIAYVPNSPSGGALPFAVNAGVGHYYGVGAYLRPLDDARRAEVRFATECLAFANLASGADNAETDLQAIMERRGVPRDLGADWDFQDVRDHYLALLYGIDPGKLRRDNPDLYLDLARATSGEVMESTFAEWRRARSPCAGGLVWTLQDLMPGAGWGVIDVKGEPKAAWYALKRAFRSVQLALTDEGVNGLALHLTNEMPQSIEVVVELTCLRDGKTPVVSVRRTMTLSPRSALEISAFELIGRFFDITYAYRFGPPGHDVTLARLLDADGATLAEAFHFPLGRSALTTEPLVTASIARDELGWFLTLSTDHLVQSLQIHDRGFRPDDDGFHLAPGPDKRIRMSPRGNCETPTGEIRAPGGRILARY